MLNHERLRGGRAGSPPEIMSATSAEPVVGSDQYPRLSFLGTRRARRNIPTGREPRIGRK